MNDWVKVYSAGRAHQAEIVLAVLEDHGIEGSMIDKKDSSYLFGEIEVYVKQEQAQAARKIIEENQL